jgi:hypothetical protein
MKTPDPSAYELNRQLQVCQSKSRRNGKVARLSLALREQINLMLDDGVPYKTIIEKLGEAGKHLNKHSISNWRSGGYQDYLKAQLINDRARTQTEAAADVVRETGDLSPAKLQQACQEVALLQYLRTLMDHGDQLAQDSFKKNPAKMITLINACCNMATTGIAIDKRKWRNQTAAATSSLVPAALRSETPTTETKPSS